MMIRSVCLTLLLSLVALGGVLRAAPPQAAQEQPPASRATANILFFGNSLTAGYGLDPAQAFPALIQEKIAARGWPMQVINAGLSGDTTAGGLRRLNWVLRRPIDVLVLELGANDGLRGLPVAEARQNLQAIIDRTRDSYPQVRIVLAGMQVPSNLGRDYVHSFQAMFPALATANQAALIPFLLAGVGGNPALNLPDGIHPTAEGHKRIAENVWQVLEPVLQSLRAP